jgi:murein L,D-transpeptidase YafK
MQRNGISVGAFKFQPAFRLAFQKKNIHTASMILLLLVGILAAESNIPKADQVLVVKNQRSLTLLSQGKILRTYKVALGSMPVGAKEQEGDHKTPEGSYVLDRRNAKSRFYKSIHVSYPDSNDRERAAQRGASPGGDIMIHGLPNRFGWLGAMHRVHDWTDGCIAVTDGEMDEIWDFVPDGTPIEIRP